MKRHLKRITGIFLCITMVLGNLPVNALAAQTEEGNGRYLPTDQAITISAEAENTITVKETEDTEEDEQDKPVEEVEGILKLQAGDYSIARDYQQECMITVVNQSELTQTFYLEAVNSYSDISLEIVNSGNKNNPMIIEPGESLEVKLSVFAQNAEQEKYYVPVMAYVQQGEEYVQDAQVSVNLNCPIPTLDLAWEKVSEDTSTLRQQYKVTNHGDTLTDLVISAAGGLEDYISFSPIISNYELQKGESVEFTVQPDLAKMKKNSVSTLSGTLVAACAGQTSSTECGFDTKGQEITVTTMGELALKQDGNSFTKFEIDKDSILFQYFNGEEYVDVTEDTAVDEIIDESVLIDYNFQSAVDLGIEEPVDFGLSIKSYVLEGDESSVDENPMISIDEEGSLVVSVKTVVSAEEYEEYINSARNEAGITVIPETSEENTAEEMEEDNTSEEMLDEEALPETLPDESGQSEEISDETDQSESIPEETPEMMAFSANVSDQTELQEIQTTSAATTAAASASPSDPNEFSEKVIDVTLKIDDALDTFGDIDISDGKLGAAGDLLDIAQLTIGGSETYNVWTDPSIEPSTKIVYTAAYVMKGILTFGSMAVTATNPVVGFFFGFASDWIDGMLDKYQAALLYEANPQKYAALYEEIFGYQCTNRGSIGASFYAPDYGTTSGIKPSIYVSSRMYEEDDSYSDQADTNYNITLNGESAGETQNAGVTDIAMAEISSDQLKPGEVNVLEMDYDTFPGHYFISTETKVTMIYPGDTEIGYIGSPEDLENVRLQPDFEIHPENIYTQSELIEGESAVVMFNVYNTGSRSGWFDVTGYDGNSLIFSEENVYLAAFGQKTFLVNWTPTADSSEITVTLTNTSVDLEELDSANNSATKTLTVRQREVPEIGNLNATVIYENSSYYMSADITEYADVSAVNFAVDGVPLNGDINSSENGSYARYRISSSEGLSAGDHTVTVTVDYQTISGTKSVTKDFSVTVQEKVIAVPYVEFHSGETILYGSNFEFSVRNTENLTRTAIVLDNGSEEIVEASAEGNSGRDYSISTAEWEPGSHSIIVKLYYQRRDSEETVEETANVTLVSQEESYYTFTLSADITDPQFSIYDSSSVRQNCEPVKAEDGTYSFLKTIDMYENPDEYTLVIRYGSGLLTRSLEENGGVISTEGCHTFTLDLDETDRISSIRIVNAGDLYLSVNMPAFDQLTLTPGTYTLSAVVYLGGQIYFSRTMDVDLNDEDQSVNLRDLVKEYTFQMEGSTAAGYNADIYYRNAGSDYWSNQRMSTIFDESSRILKCYVTSAYSVERIEQAEEVRIVVSSEDEIYLAQIKSPVSLFARILGMSNRSVDDCITLSRDSLNKVSLICSEEGLSFEQAEVSTDLYSVTLYKNTVYLPEDDYTIKATLNTGYQTVVGMVETEVRQDMEVEVDKEWETRLSDVEISWAEQFDNTAEVECSASTGNWISASDFTNGSTFKVENGYRNFSFNLTQGLVGFYITKSMDIDEDNAGIQIGRHFSGNIYSSFTGEYEGGSSVNIYLSNLSDENDNWLSSINGYRQPLYGNVIFTDVNNPDNVQIIQTTATSNSMSITIPEVPGTYQIQVELFTYATQEDEEHVHTVVIDESVPATCTTDGLTEGSHCSVCGEVISPQQAVPALGHNYGTPVFCWDSDNSCTAELTCTVCGEVQEIECTVEQKTDDNAGETGQITYTATVNVNGQIYTDSKIIEIVPEEPGEGEDPKPEQPGESDEEENTKPEQPGGSDEGDDTKPEQSGGSDKEDDVKPEQPGESGGGENAEQEQVGNSENGQEKGKTNSTEKLNDSKDSVSKMETKNSKNVTTDDEHSPALWAVLMSISGVSLVYILRSRKKRNTTKR